MTKVYLFSQNLRIESLEQISDKDSTVQHVFLTTQYLFDYEKEYITRFFSNPVFIFYGNILSDSENEQCDTDAYKAKNKNVTDYYNRIRYLKNLKILEHLKEKYPNIDGYILCDDLGIDKNVWLNEGFKFIHLDFYYTRNETKHSLKRIIKSNYFLRGIYTFITRDLFHIQNKNLTKEIYIGYVGNHKYVFIGKMSRISYRMDTIFQISNEEYLKLCSGKFEKKDRCTYITTLHESCKNMIPDKNCYDVRYIQDGYLPGNYSSKYLCFKPNNVSYYAWDILGEEIFKNHSLPVSLLPFRKKIFLPTVGAKKITTILVATSGPGDWTAQKNRSDEDLMIVCFVEIAKCFPNIKIVYRCHPTWTHPDHNGVNSINRIASFIEKSNVPNLFLSTNIPTNSLNKYSLSFSRNSLNEDLKNADLVFGEHSISMIDGALLGIPFCSINLTKRRNLFEGISILGFPHCNTVEDVKKVILSFENSSFIKSYNEAVRKYNEMTDRDCDSNG